MPPYALHNTMHLGLISIHTHPEIVCKCLQISPNFPECRKGSDSVHSLSQNMSILELLRFGLTRPFPSCQCWPSIVLLPDSHILAMFQLKRHSSHQTVLNQHKHCIAAFSLAWISHNLARHHLQKCQLQNWFFWTCNHEGCSLCHFTANSIFNYS